MTRRTVTYTVEQEGRDKGKTFLLTEMPAAVGEEWAVEALFALMNTGVDIPADALNDGMTGLIGVGLGMLQRVPYAQMQPLYARLFDCVTVVPNPAKPSVTRPLVESDTEEIKTRFILRWEVLKLHADFLTGAVPSQTSIVP